MALMYEYLSTSLNDTFKWRIDEDGFLRITMCVLRSGVFNYAKKDMPKEITDLKPDLEVWRLKVQPDFSESFLKSLEGKSVITFKHDWQDVETISKEDIMGSSAGVATVEDGAIILDAVIHDADTIKLIQEGKLVEISAGYNSGVEISDTDDCDAVQIPLNGNHFVLLPKGEGRCGHSVRILNQKETVMVKVKIMNSTGQEAEYQFTNEADAKVAESMLQEQGKTQAVQMEAKNHDLASAQQKFAEINDALTALEAEKLLLEQKIKQFESEEYQEGVAMEREQYKADENAVIENGCGEEEKKELQAKLQNSKSIEDRRKVVTAHICNSKGIAYDEKDAKILFKVLCKTLNKASVTEIRKPAPVAQANAQVHPIFHRG